MHEVVHSNLHSKLFGKGLPDQMRSAAFAFLGLTAAGALALVAIFAQLGFPLLAPAPLPSDPSRHNAVAEAVPLKGGAAGIAPRRQAPAASGQAGSVRREPEESSAPSATATQPAPSGDTGFSPPADGGGSPSPAPTPTPVPSPSPAPSPPTPATSPGQPPPAAAPEPAPVAPPVPTSQPPTPPPPPVVQPPAATAAPPAPAASPPAHSNAGGNGKGNAYGHSK